MEGGRGKLGEGQRREKGRELGEGRGEEGKGEGRGEGKGEYFTTNHQCK